MSCALPEVAGHDGGRSVFEFEPILPSDERVQCLPRWLVDLRVGGQQDHLVARMGEVAVQEPVAVRPIQAAQWGVDDDGERVSRRSGKAPQ